MESGFEQHAPGHRRRLQNRGTSCDKQVQQVRSVGCIISLGDNQSCSDSQRQQQFERRYIEGQRGHRQQPVVRRNPDLVGDRQQQIHDGTMRDFHAFWFAG